jgi:hypothetical protein
MRSFITALAMVAVATTSFAIGRSTSGSGTVLVVTDRPASLDIASLQSVSRNLPELRVDTPF